MMDLSVLIPQRDAGEALVELVANIDGLLRRSGQSYEIVIVDDASHSDTLRAAEQLGQRFAPVRCLRLDRPSGLSAALTAGIAAARGEIVVAIEASRQYAPQQMTALIERLSRADLVCGRRQRGRLAKLALAAAQAPRRMLLGLEVRDPDCLFWAARREALVGLELPAGMHRFLGTLVTTRGFRVAEINVDHKPATGQRSFDQARPSLGNLLAAWWQRRSLRPFAAVEIGAKPLASSPTARALQANGTVHRAAA
jgi:glycosyltransferase involved in cell wall biosynthesis